MGEEIDVAIDRYEFKQRPWNHLYYNAGLVVPLIAFETALLVCSLYFVIGYCSIDGAISPQ